MTKTLKLDDGTNELTLGAVEVEENWDNSLESFQRPDQTGGSPETRALNLNRVEHIYKISAEMDDEVTNKLNSGLSTKEDAKTRLYTLAESVNLITLTYGSETITGYIQKIGIDETADDDATSYSFTINFLKAVAMSS